MTVPLIFRTSPPKSNHSAEYRVKVRIIEFPLDNIRKANEVAFFFFNVKAEGKYSISFESNGMECGVEPIPHHCAMSNILTSLPSINFICLLMFVCDVQHRFSICFIALLNFKCDFRLRLFFSLSPLSSLFSVHPT